jgi:putative transposase
VLRWGRQGGYIFGAQKVAIEHPGVRTLEGQEVPLETYQRLQRDGRRQRRVREGLLVGLTTRNYRRAAQSVLGGYGIEKSSVSRQFVQASTKQLKELCERRLDDRE